jgi:hypothetical protein
MGRAGQEALRFLNASMQVEATTFHIRIAKGMACVEKSQRLHVHQAY